MKILFIGLASHYTDGMTYQDNLLAEQSSLDGNDTIFVSNCNYYKNGKLISCQPGTEILKTGVKLIRISYDNIFNDFFSSKIRKAKTLKKILVSFRPDVVFFHGTCGYEIMNVAQYKNQHKNTRFYVDCHEAYYNSAQTFLSKYILHKLIYRFFFKKAYSQIDNIFYVGYGEKEYLKDIMKVPENRMEFMPLGGYVISQEKKKEYREKIRKQNNINQENIVFIHTGKLDSLKRTNEILKAFYSISNKKFILLILGTASDNLLKEINDYTEIDERIKYLGWKNSNELIEYLCASDLYLQPGSVSATLQISLCCGLPAMIYPYESYGYIDKSCVYSVETIDDMKKVFFNISKNPEQIYEMSKNAKKFAEDNLDYTKLINKIY